MPLPPAAAEHLAPVSAPVSRSIPSYQSAATVPSKVDLSLEEREMARLSGISDVEYAANKIRLLRAKAAGMYPDHG
jgi:hypothetical protein